MNLIQPDAPLAIALAKPGPATTGSNTRQGSFATALLSAVGDGVPAKASSPAKPETPKPSPEEKMAQSPQQMLAPATIPIGPALPVLALKVEIFDPPFSSLPGVVGKRDVAPPQAAEPFAPGDITSQPTTIPLSFPSLAGTTGDAPSSIPPGRAAPGSPGFPPATPQGFTNPADPMMRLAQPIVLAPPASAATTLSSSRLQSPLPSTVNTASDDSALQASMSQLAFQPAPVASQAVNVSTSDGATLAGTSAKVASGGQLPAEFAPEQAAAFAPTPDNGSAAAAAGPQPRANLQATGKPPRVLDTEARRVGSLPLRDLISSVTALAEVSKPIANVPMQPQLSKLTALPAQLKGGVSTLTSPVLNPAKDSQGSPASAGPGNTPNQDDTAPKGKPMAPDNPGPSVSPASSAPDSPALPRQIDTQPDSLPTATPVAVIPTAASQNSGGQAPATSPLEPPVPQPVRASSDATTSAVSSVQSARVVQGVAQSEMHIGFRSPAFGSVEVHTAVRDTQLGLSVSSERGDLRGFLVQEVPGLQTVFHQQGLQFDQIRFVAPGSGTGTGFSSGANSNSNSPGNGRNPRSWFSQAPASQADSATSEIQISSTRLSVHA